MMSTQQAPVASRLRHACVVVVGVVLTAAGLGMAAVAGDPPVHLTLFGVPALLLVPLYVAAHHRPLYLEFRRDTLGINLTQLPLTLGVLLVDPLAHVLLRAAAVLFDSVALRRQPAAKAAFNLGSAVLELGIVALAVASVGQLRHPGPALWLALYLGVLAGELAGQLALQLLVLPLLGRRPTAAQVFGPARVVLATSTLFTAVAAVAISALWTDTSAVVLIVLLVGFLAAGYRGYRLQATREQRTERLYDFVRELQPLTVAGPTTRDVLQDVRTLLHARSLDLATRDAATGGWRHHTVWDESQPEPGHTGPGHIDPGHTDPGSPPTGASGDQRHMSVPLYGEQGLVGVLSATDRLGANRPFDLADQRLLETVALELADAFERGRLQADLQRAATTDTVTGLPNLEETTRRLAALLAGEAEAADRAGVVVLAIAVESFREVNDTLGHEIGDRLLREVARRLQEAAPDALVGRLGGGRFALAVPAAQTGGDMALFGLQLRARVEGTAQIGTVGTHVRLAVGCVRAPEHGLEAGTLLRRAETAMNSATAAGGGPVAWEAAYEVLGQRRLALVAALREALATGAVGVAYQPKLDLQTGRVTGVEALARWTHPALGYVPPDEFIPLAETSGLMGALTSSVLSQALTACRGWQRRSPHVGVAVNVSAETVLEAGFLSEVQSLLTACGLPAELLTLELTESVMLRDPEVAVARMRELRALGVLLAVDDFGTGYSSLTYLKGLPVDEVKIDRGFVDRLAVEPGDRAVVRAVVDIAHTLGMRIVAEGVEDAEQQAILQSLGVDEVQGYLHARPMPAVGVATWLRAREAAALLE